MAEWHLRCGRTLRADVLLGAGIVRRIWRYVEVQKDPLAQENQIAPFQEK